jgi:hypothetical protein
MTVGLKSLAWMASLLWTVSCALPQPEVNTPQADARYPQVLRDTPERRAAALEAWRAFLKDHSLPDVEPDLEPILNTPRSLPQALVNQIAIGANANNANLNAADTKAALRRFIEKSRQVLGGPQTKLFEVNDLSLTSFSEDGGFYRAVYRQMSFPFPLANNFGELRLACSKNGRLMQMSSRLVPDLEFRERLTLEIEGLPEKQVGREFIYRSVAGRPMTYRVASVKEIGIRDPVIFPVVRPQRLVFYIAYPVVVGKGMTWTVYVDAVRGRELGVQQNFET